MFSHKPATRGENFLRMLDEVIERHAMLKHPFYQSWNEGKLSRATLAEYAKQYYAHVRAFPTYVSAVHSNCDDRRARLLLLENLQDEEQGDENHPELWLRFAEALGVRREQTQSAELLPSTIQSVNTMRRLTRSQDFLEGIAALYAYESQIPEVARTKREGLKAFYGIDELQAVSFFTVHEQADLIHRKAEREILSLHCDTEVRQERVLRAAEEAAKTLWHFLDGVNDAYVKGGC